MYLRYFDLLLSMKLPIKFERIQQLHEAKGTHKSLHIHKSGYGLVVSKLTW